MLQVATGFYRIALFPARSSGNLLLCFGLVATGIQLSACAGNPAPAHAPGHPGSSQGHTTRQASVQPCRPTKRVAPAYPALAQTENIEGTIRVCFTINGAGKVENAHIVHTDLYPVGYNSTKSLLRKAALDAIRQWKFPPAGSGDGANPRKACQQFGFGGSMDGFVPP